VPQRRTIALQLMPDVNALHRKTYCIELVSNF